MQSPFGYSTIPEQGSPTLRTARREDFSVHTLLQEMMVTKLSDTRLRELANATRETERKWRVRK